MPKKSFGKLPPVIKFLLLVVWVITDSSLSCKKFLNLCTNIRIALRLYSIMVHFGEKSFQRPIFSFASIIQASKAKKCACKRKNEISKNCHKNSVYKHLNLHVHENK